MQKKNKEHHRIEMPLMSNAAELRLRFSSKQNIA